MSEISPKIPEFARPSGIHGNDPELTKLVEQADENELQRRQLEAAGHYHGGTDRPLFLPEDHVKHEMVKGLSMNEDFNKGIEHGPWKAPEEAVRRDIELGYTEKESQDKFAAMRTSQSAMKNTYPFSRRAGESGEIIEEAERDYKDIVKIAGQRIRDQLVDKPKIS